MLSLKQFTDKYAGRTVANPIRKNYAGECVSLIQTYLYECYGITDKARGDAIYWANNSLLTEGLAKKVSTPQYGDILVYGKPFGYINGKYYGHVVIYINKSLIFDQNNSNVKPTRTAQFRPMFNAKPIAILRMKAALVSDKVKLTNAQVAQEIYRGLGGWGNNPGRKQKLEAAGYNYAAVQTEVNKLLGVKATVPKPTVDIDNLARRTYNGEFGNGVERKRRLGKSYAAVQARVNELYFKK